uniref:YhdP family protein n=1 Tax=Stappia sp. TaxID=1870903 RepID=UPI003BAA1051
MRDTLRTRRRRRVLRGFGWLAVLLAILAGVGVVIALQGPLSVGYLARAVEARISSDRTQVTIGAATLDFSEGFPARIELLNVTMEAEGDVPIAVVVPRITAPLDVGAALTGHVAVSEVVLEQPRLTVHPVAGGTSEIPDMDQLSLAADSFARLALEHLAERTIHRIELVSAELVSEGEETYRMRGIDAELTREGDEILTVRAEIAGRLGRWRVGARRSVDPDTGARLIRLDIDDVTLGEFLPVDTDIRTGKGLGVPVDLRLETELDNAGAFKATRLSTVVSPGWVNTGRTIVAFDRIDVQVQWLAGAPGFQIAPSYYTRGRTVIPFEGVVEPPRDWQERWSFRIVSRGAEIGPSDVPGPPYEMEYLVVEGDADPVARELGFDRITLRSGTANLDGAGSLKLAEDGPYLALAMESGPMAVATLKRLWPITMVPPARAWVIEHVIDGRVDGGRATVALTPPAFDVSDPRPGWSGNDVNVDIDLSDLTLKTIGTVPIVQRLGGKVELKDEILSVTAKDGIVAARAGEQLTLPGATFSIPDVRKHGDKTGVLSLDLDGPAASVATVLDAKPLNVLSERGLSPDGISGSASVTLDARFPLVRELSLEDVAWKLSGNVRNFSSDKPIQGNTISAADLTFDVDASRLELKGKGRLDGLPADLDLVLPLGDGTDAVAARQGVVLNATADQLAKRGIDLREFVNGSMRMAVDEKDGGQSFDIDLTRARIDLAQVGWTKSPGVPARARFTMTESGGAREIRGFEFTSEGVEITGTLSLDGKGNLKRAQFSRFALRPSDEATLRVSRDGRTYVADFQARRFDARGLIASLTGSGRGSEEGSSSAAFRVSAEVDQMTGFNNVSLNGVSLRMTSAGGEVRSLSATGHTSASGTFEFNLTPSEGQRVMTGVVGDTGAVLRFANLYDRMRGGTGLLNITMAKGNIWSGKFRVKRLAITEDPAIRALARTRVVAEGDPRRRQAFVGSERQGEASFSALDLTFVRNGDRLEITEGTLTGATVGGTVSGSVNMAERTLDLTGTFVPAFALNNLFAKIPILGLALGGGADEGLIGVTYKVTGAIGDPVLTVNPASAIAPGIFRKLFEYR